MIGRWVERDGLKWKDMDLDKKSGSERKRWKD